MANQQDDRRPANTDSSVPARRGSATTKWTIAGISPRTRTAVRKAARKDGVTIGAWVDQALLAAATDSLKGGIPVLALPPELLAGIDDISRKLDQINREVARNEERFTSFSPDFRQILIDLQGQMSEAVDRIQKGTASMVDTVVEQTESGVEQSKQLAEKTRDRLADVGDTALDSLRQLRGNASDDSANRDEAKRNK